MVNYNNSSLKSSAKTSNKAVLRLLDLPRSAIDLIVYFVAYNDDAESNDLDPIVRNALSIGRETPQFPYHLCHLLQTCRVLRDSALKTVFNKDILWSKSFFELDEFKLRCKRKIHDEARCSCRGTEKILHQRQINFYKTVLPFLRSFNLDRVSNTFSAIAGVSLVESMISAKSPIQEITLLDPRIESGAHWSRVKRGRATMLSALLPYTSHSIRALCVDSAFLKDVDILLSHRLPNLTHLEVHFPCHIGCPVEIDNSLKLLQHYSDCSSIIETLVLKCTFCNNNIILKCLDKYLHLIPHLKELHISISCPLVRTDTNLFGEYNAWTEKVTKLKLKGYKVLEDDMKFIMEMCQRDTFREIEFLYCTDLSLLKDLRQHGVDFGKKITVYKSVEIDHKQALLRKFQSCCPNLRTLRLNFSTRKELRILKSLLSKTRSLTEVSFEGFEGFWRASRYNTRLLADGLIQCPSKLKKIALSQFPIIRSEILAIMNVHRRSIEGVDFDRGPQFGQGDGSTWRNIARILRNLTHSHKFVNLRSFHISSTHSSFQPWDRAIDDISNCQVLSDISQHETEQIIRTIDYMSSLHHAREAFRNFEKKFPCVDANRLDSSLRKTL